MKTMKLIAGLVGVVSLLAIAGCAGVAGTMPESEQASVAPAPAPEPAPAPAAASADVAALSPKCADLPGDYPATGADHAWAQCWHELDDQPGCYVYRDHYHINEHIRGSGECSNGVVKRGTMTIEGNGAIFEGPVVDGKKHGRWDERDANGEVGEGSYVEGKRSGEWFEVYPDGTIYEGSYDENNADHWTGVERYQNGNVAEGSYRIIGGRWLKDGEWHIRGPDGAALGKGCYSGGKEVACN